MHALRSAVLCYSLILRLPLSSLDFGFANSKFGPHPDIPDPVFPAPSPSAVLPSFPAPCHPVSFEPLFAPFAYRRMLRLVSQMWLSADDHQSLVADLIPVLSLSEPRSSLKQHALCRCHARRDSDEAFGMAPVRSVPQYLQLCLCLGTQHPACSPRHHMCYIHFLLRKIDSVSASPGGLRNPRCSMCSLQ